MSELIDLILIVVFSMVGLTVLLCIFIIFIGMIILPIILMYVCLQNVNYEETCLYEHIRNLICIFKK